MRISNVANQAFDTTKELNIQGTQQEIDLFCDNTSFTFDCEEDHIDFIQITVFSKDLHNTDKKSFRAELTKELKLIRKIK
tara:strand:- start:202 stop:441 length:240 start_codon:yes stop_codon:yes gene_type:complete